jgi:large subunit ribosomal protein L17
MQNKHSELLIRNIVTDLCTHGKIKTTLKRAKIVSSEIERLISFAKKNNKMLAIRKLNTFLLNKEASNNLMSKILPKFEKTSSGFTRIIKTGFRAGDCATVCYIEFTI